MLGQLFLPQAREQLVARATIKRTSDVTAMNAATLARFRPKRSPARPPCMAGHSIRMAADQPAEIAMPTYASLEPILQRPAVPTGAMSSPVSFAGAAPSPAA